MSASSGDGREESSDVSARSDAALDTMVIRRDAHGFPWMVPRFMQATHVCCVFVAALQRSVVLEVLLTLRNLFTQLFFNSSAVAPLLGSDGL